jgi:MFS family permease
VSDAEAAPVAPRADLWRDRDFLRLWSAATVTNFGSMVAGIALPLAAIQVLRATPAELAVLRAAALLPGFLLGLQAGAWLDRRRRRPVLIAADLGRAALQASVAGAAALGVLAMAQLYAVAFLGGLLGFVFHVAHGAYLPALVSKRALVGANARLQAGEAAAEGAGFGVGGWMVQLLGAPTALLVDSASFLASGALIARIRAPEPPAESRARASGVRASWREIWEGLAFVARQRELRALALCSALAAAGWQATGVVYFLFLDGLGFGAGGMGLVFAIGSLSSLLGASAAERVGTLLGARAGMVAGLAAYGASLLLVPLVPGPGPLGFALLAAQQAGDGAEVVYAVHARSLRQAAAPARLQARVGASFAFLGGSAALVGAGLGGVLGEWLGPRATLAAGAALVLLAAPVLAFGARGDLRRVAAHEEA